MDIIIAGAGRVGFRLAKVLSAKHNVTIMDKNTEALNKIQERIDVLTVPGNVQDPDSYEALRGREVDLFIAVTDVDEVNLVSSIIADEKIRVKRKIIRLRNEFFARSSIAEKIAITDAVFPYSLTAASVRALLDYPKANNVKGFPETPMKLVSVRANFHHAAHTVPLEQINSKRVMVVGIDRKKDFHIPGANDAIRQDDMVYLFGDDEAIRELCGRFDHKMPRRIRKIVILGADTLGVEIAKALSVHSATIKLIEKDLEKCRRAAEILQDKATVINSKYGDFRLYRDEGLANAEMLIASTANDEENIIKCIEAKEHGIEKVVAINNDLEYYNLMHSLGLVIVRGPKTNAFYSIMETIGSSTAVNEKLFCGGAAICFVRDLNGYRGTIRPLLRHNVLSCIISADALRLFDAPAEVEERSVVMSFCSRCREDEVRRWINEL